MGKLFNLDSPFMQFLNKVADLMWLNVLTLICCIPIFTIGASLTAAHYAALKLKRNEEGYITREFFKSFKMNFRQATLIWLIALVFIIVLACDFYIMGNSEGISYWIRVVIMAAGVLLTFTLTWVFAMQARFTNTIKSTIKNAFAFSILKFPRTILMIVVNLVPLALFVLDLRTFPIVLFFGISVPIYVSAMLYNKVFKDLEERIMARLEAEKQGENAEKEQESGASGEEEEKIFSDEPAEEENKTAR